MSHKGEAFILWAFLADTASGCLPETLVQSMVKNLEKQLEAPAKKPVGGVKLFLMPDAGPQRAATPGREPQVGCRMLGSCPESPCRASSEFGGPRVGIGGGSCKCQSWL